MREAKKNSFKGEVVSSEPFGRRSKKKKKNCEAVAKAIPNTPLYRGQGDPTYKKLDEISLGIRNNTQKIKLS